jgi:hypothetical protein
MERPDLNALIVSWHRTVGWIEHLEARLEAAERERDRALELLRSAAHVASEDQQRAEQAEARIERLIEAGDALTSALYPITAYSRGVEEHIKAWDAAKAEQPADGEQGGGDG